MCSLMEASPLGTKISILAELKVAEIERKSSLLHPEAIVRKATPIFYPIIAEPMNPEYGKTSITVSH